jgi:hypothetical protein
VSYSQGPSVSRWQTGSAPGTALACNESFSRLSSRLLKGGLDIPSPTTLASGSLPLVRPHDRCEHAPSRTQAEDGFMAEHAASLLVYERTE